MRGYMWLYDKPRAYVDYCLVDTPEDLIGWEQQELHIVSHLPVENRVRSIFMIVMLIKRRKSQAWLSMRVSITSN